MYRLFGFMHRNKELLQHSIELLERARLLLSVIWALLPWTVFCVCLKPTKVKLSWHYGMKSSQRNRDKAGHITWKIIYIQKNIILLLLGMTVYRCVFLAFQSPCTDRHTIFRCTCGKSEPQTPVVLLWFTYSCAVCHVASTFDDEVVYSNVIRNNCIHQHTVKYLWNRFQADVLRAYHPGYYWEI